MLQHFFSDETETCILTMLQQVGDKFCPCILTMLHHLRDIFAPQNRNMYSYRAATCQGHFCPPEEKHVFSLCCNMSGTCFVPLNRTMYSSHAATCQRHFMSHWTVKCILTNPQHIRSNCCPIEQEHVFLPCCNMSGIFLSHWTETCILATLRHIMDIFCPIKHVFSLCCNISGPYLSHWTEMCIPTCCNMSETYYAP